MNPKHTVWRTRRGRFASSDMVERRALVRLGLCRPGIWKRKDRRVDSDHNFRASKRNTTFPDITPEDLPCFRIRTSITHLPTEQRTWGLVGKGSTVHPLRLSFSSAMLRFRNSIKRGEVLVNRYRPNVRFSYSSFHHFFPTNPVRLRGWKRIEQFPNSRFRRE